MSGYDYTSQYVQSSASTASTDPYYTSDPYPFGYYRQSQPQNDDYATDVHVRNEENASQRRNLSHLSFVPASTDPYYRSDPFPPAYYHQSQQSQNPPDQNDYNYAASGQVQSKNASQRWNSAQSRNAPQQNCNAPQQNRNAPQQNRNAPQKHHNNTPQQNRNISQIFNNNSPYGWVNPQHSLNLNAQQKRNYPPPSSSTTTTTSAGAMAGQSQSQSQKVQQKRRYSPCSTNDATVPVPAAKKNKNNYIRPLRPRKRGRKKPKSQRNTTIDNNNGNGLGNGSGSGNGLGGNGSGLGDSGSGLGSNASNSIQSTTKPMPNNQNSRTKNSSNSNTGNSNSITCTQYQLHYEQPMTASFPQTFGKNLNQQNTAGGSGINSGTFDHLLIGQNPTGTNTNTNSNRNIPGTGGVDVFDNLFGKNNSTTTTNNNCGARSTLETIASKSNLASTSTSSHHTVYKYADGSNCSSNTFKHGQQATTTMNKDIGHHTHSNLMPTPEGYSVGLFPKCPVVVEPTPKNDHNSNSNRQQLYSHSHNDSSNKDKICSTSTAQSLLKQLPDPKLDYNNTVTNTDNVPRGKNWASNRERKKQNMLHKLDLAEAAVIKHYNDTLNGTIVYKHKATYNNTFRGKNWARNRKWQKEKALEKLAEEKANLIKMFNGQTPLHKLSAAAKANEIKTNKNTLKLVQYAKRYANKNTLELVQYAKSNNKKGQNVVNKNKVNGFLRQQVGQQDKMPTTEGNLNEDKYRIKQLEREVDRLRGIIRKYGLDKVVDLDNIVSDDCRDSDIEKSGSDEANDNNNEGEASEKIDANNDVEENDNEDECNENIGAVIGNVEKYFEFGIEVEKADEEGRNDNDRDNDNDEDCVCIGEGAVDNKKSIEVIDLDEEDSDNVNNNDDKDDKGFVGDNIVNDDEIEDNEKDFIESNESIESDNGGENCFEIDFGAENTVESENGAENCVETENSAEHFMETEKVVENSVVTETVVENSVETETVVENSAVTETNVENSAVTETNAKNSAVTETNAENCVKTEKDAENCVYTNQN